MNSLVSTLVALSVVLELAGLVGIALSRLSVQSTVTLWLVAFVLLVVARGCERFEFRPPHDADVSR
ncbi:hypothetical protein [Halomarina rubra]|uniref:Uncharacterized protein n=1 Tax=Halomarina rubra TaxID=2071873 RepID=A0ABD6AZ19_9EURY|nr:hypothetical protein [Halomarina rubra]